MTQYLKDFIRYLHNTRAVSALEYAILVGAIAVGMGTIVTAFSEDINAALQGIGDQLGKANIGGDLGDVTNDGS